MPILGVNDDFTLLQRVSRSLAQSLGAIRNVTADNTPTRLPNVRCFSVIFTNTSGKAINITRGGIGTALRLPNNAGKQMDVQLNADELYIANAEDTSSVTVGIECPGEVVVAP